MKKDVRQMVQQIRETFDRIYSTKKYRTTLPTADRGRQNNLIDTVMRLKAQLAQETKKEFEKANELLKGSVKEAARFE
ncbi:hypothetical protein P152DRAFT_454871 [Eremomyces bilateralis CBS 781.70]|uniref:Uncharacterized protein n=1 Tax=Eremomyces bilateralis CBS 781.70 TaxID=1392243 RepID=A0A6G1GEY2_9PEZI|nr:uncharacterized protein P152DRAFT_454871 [Eremomyces bilateralis CBS 781.70]KAF1816637.1 hypothetical protein P152DRAFT_454871 [Eremomyces bilateralis CBS 781.70]